MTENDDEVTAKKKGNKKRIPYKATSALLHHTQPPMTWKLQGKKFTDRN